VRRAGQLLRIAKQLLSPMTWVATQASLERGWALRRVRAVEAMRDSAQQRRHPSRPRMRALVVGPGGHFAWRSAPQPPAPGPVGAVVHPIAVSTCDLDRALALGDTPFPLPLHFGHECVAEVLEIGEQVRTVRPGQRVVVPFQISCGACAKCRAGLTSNCESVPPISMYGFGVGGGHWGGAFSDALAVPFADGMLVPLPEGVKPMTAASVADNIADAYRHVAPHLPGILQRQPDAHVIIVAGHTRRAALSPSLPLYAGLIARALGAGDIVLADARADVRAHAERLGLTACAPRDLRGVERAPLVIAASGSARGLRTALCLTADDGICTSVGGLHRSARIPQGIMFARNVTYTVGRANARAVIPQVLDMIAAGAIEPQAVTTQTGSLDEAPVKMHAHVHGGEIKTILGER
jgi:alcohol dehydrogenase